MIHPKTGVELICFRLAGEEGMVLPAGTSASQYYTTVCGARELWLSPEVLYTAIREAAPFVQRVAEAVARDPRKPGHKLPRINAPEPEQLPAPEPSADFQRGAEAMRCAIQAAKFDALSAGELDLSRFEIRNVKPGPQ